MGIRTWLGYRRDHSAEAGEKRTNAPISLPSVILLTMANGADNIGVYILVFSSYNAGIT